MSTINIYDLNPVGSELFNDSESYMMDVSGDEIQGGLSIIRTTPITDFPWPTRTCTTTIPFPITKPISIPGTLL